MTVETKKGRLGVAPPAGQVPTKENSMTIIAPAPDTQPTMGESSRRLRFLPNQTAPSADEQAWAAAHLDMPVRVNFLDRPARILSNGDKLWRDAGVIAAFWASENPHFLIRLASDATEQDLEWLEQQVARAKGGAFLEHGWIEHQRLSDGSAFGGFAWGRGVGDDEGRSNDRVVPCDEPLCDHHGSDRPYHFASVHDFTWNHRRVEGSTLSGWLAVTIERPNTSPHWQIAVDASAEGDLLPVEDAEACILAIQKALAKVRRLNAASS